MKGSFGWWCQQAKQRAKTITPNGTGTLIKVNQTHGWTQNEHGTYTSRHPLDQIEIINTNTVCPTCGHDTGYDHDWNRIVNELIDHLDQAGEHTKASEYAGRLA